MRLVSIKQSEMTADGQPVVRSFTMTGAQPSPAISGAQLGSKLSVGATPPPAIQESLNRFKVDYPPIRKTAFVMMRFGTTAAHTAIVNTIREALNPLSIVALRADDKQYHDDLFDNVLTYVYGCDFGIAVFERIEAEEFNPNVSLEIGYLLALNKPVCLLKDKTLKTLHTDLMGKLYRTFDPLDPHETIPRELGRWVKDKGLS